MIQAVLVEPDFAEAIQNVPAPGQEEAVMGEHFPRSSYSSVEEFEDRGC